MQRARRFRIVCVALGVGLCGFLALSACSSQGEGERCERANNNSDCQDGLVCTFKEQLPQGYNTTSDRCCPADRATATHPACVQPQATVGGDSAPPAETGPSVDATVDSADSAETSASDGGADAADDGG
jgi:hypothetical protein